MKFSINSTKLLSELQKVSFAIASNPVLPILEDFLFSIKSNVLTITATDLENTIVTSCEVMADADLLIAVPAKIIVDTLKALPQQPITFTIDTDTYAIQIKSANGKYKLAGENGEDFPQLPELENSDSFEMESSQLLHAIGLTAFATSNDELRPAMTGVYMEVQGKKTTFVATDAHKLSRVVHNSKKEHGIEKNVIIPKKSLNILKNNLKEGAVKISINEANVFFESGDIKIIGRLIDARYPDYNAVMPTDNPNTLQLVRNDMKGSLKRIVIYANKTTNQVALHIEDGKLTIKAEDLDFSNEASEEIICTYSGEPMTIGFNAKFLIEILSVLDSEEITINLSTPNRAGIISPVGNDEFFDIDMLAISVSLG